MKTLTPTIKPTKKQQAGWDYLLDNITKYVLFGGGAGGGKTWLGSEWLITRCYMYPESKWFIGREELKRLKRTTLETFYKACKHHGIPSEDYNLHGQDNVVYFRNGSSIDLLDLAAVPRDPMFERFGSLEYTGGWIEEAGETAHRAFDVLKSRIGRHMNREYGLKAKMYLTANPKKNWLYKLFYKPWKEGRLPPEYAFIQSLVGDNKHIDPEYIQNLKEISDKAMKERLLFGNWEYDDDPSTLVDYDAIVDLFTNIVDGMEGVSPAMKYCTVDVSRLGGDKTVFMLWKGYWCYKIYVFTKQTIDVTATKLDSVLRAERIPRSHTVVDEGGVGGGLVDMVKGVKGFVSNASPIQAPKTELVAKGFTKPNYDNLKSQCSYMLADKINGREMSYDNVEVIGDASLISGWNDEFTEELEQLKAWDAEKGAKLRIIPKDKIREVIGRSPDYADSAMMRMYFDLDIKKATFGVQRH